MATSIHLQHFKIYTVEGEQEGEEKEDAVAEQERSEGPKEVVSDRSQNSRARSPRRGRGRSGVLGVTAKLQRCSNWIHFPKTMTMDPPFQSERQTSDKAPLFHSRNDKRCRLRSLHVRQ